MVRWLIHTSRWVRYTQNNEDLSRSQPAAHPLFTAQIEAGNGACGTSPVRTLSDDEWGCHGEGIKRTSPISVRSVRAAVVDDGWLPVAATRRTVDFADRNVVKFTVAVGITGVSPLTSPLSRLVKATEVVSLGRLFGHRGGGCGNAG